MPITRSDPPKVHTVRPGTFTNTRPPVQQQAEDSAAPDVNDPAVEVSDLTADGGISVPQQSDTSPDTGSDPKQPVSANRDLVTNVGSVAKSIRTVAIEPGRPCLKCSHLVEGAQHEYDCTRENGNDSCPAGQFQISTKVNTKKAARALANAVLSGDLQKLLQVSNKMFEYTQQGVLPDHDTARIFRRAIALIKE